MVASKLTRPVAHSFTLTEDLFMKTLTEEEINDPNTALAVFPNGAAFDLFEVVRTAPTDLLEEIDACTEIPNPHPCLRPIMLACLLIRAINRVPLEGHHFTAENLR
jgi:hypothetical protein